MNTVFKFPVSKLPAELRGDFAEGEFVTVTVASEDELLPGFTHAEIDELMAPAVQEEERGEGTVCVTADDVERHFASLRVRVDAKYNTA